MMRNPQRSISGSCDCRLQSTPARLFSLVLGALLSVMTLVAHGAEPVSKSRFGSVAIGGHDTAAYHELSQEPQATAIKGSKSYVVKYKGAKWRFASEESAARFRADPERYSPAYNGYCANALSLGNGLVRTDGTHWEIFEDKLYLFFAANGRTRWLDGNWQTYKAVSDAEWDRLKNR